ncbi:MAG: acetolactate synthase large subunit, partial [Acidimicrobiales bacterium]|nr:acetolactate synthase large subunit [Acidimicrobiales bacterium]
ADKPAATLLHLGPGLGNGLANLHNARRAGTPMVNIVGDHATGYGQDVFLTSDIDTVARNLEGWVGTARSSADVGRLAAEAVAAAAGAPNQIATLILPADASWSDGAEPAPARAPAAPATVPAVRIEEVARVLRGDGPVALVVGGTATREAGVTAASRLGAHTGAKVYCECFPTRLERGAGVPALERLGYLGEFVQMQLEGIRHLVLVDADLPASFFAYPDKDTVLVPDGCEVHVLAGPGDDATGALEALADAVGAPADAATAQELALPDRPTGELDPETLGAAIARLLPEQAVLVDESATAGLWTSLATAGSHPHTLLTLTGGAIGYGLPAATGAALACPDRPVVSLEADGSGMYTLQALWTQAREDLNVTTVVYNNHAYDILNLELGRVGAGEPGPKAKAMFDLHGPDLDFVKLAGGMGVPASRPTTAEEFADAFEMALAEPGPYLIEVGLTSRF